jgi:hypothetical protein
MSVQQQHCRPSAGVTNEQLQPVGLDHAFNEVVEHPVSLPRARAQGVAPSVRASAR